MQYKAAYKHRKKIFRGRRQWINKNTSTMMEATQRDKRTSVFSNPISIHFRVLKIFLLGVSVVIPTGCSSLNQLSNISLIPSDRPSSVSTTASVLAAFEGQPQVTTKSDWEQNHVPTLRRAIQRDLYGFAPDKTEILNQTIERVDDNAYDGTAVIDLVTMTIGINFANSEQMERTIRIAIAKPKQSTNPPPVILKMDTCPFNEAFQNENLPDGNSKFILPVSAIDPEQLPDPLPNELVGKESIEATANATCKQKGAGPTSSLIRYSLGRYHYTPPIKEAIAQGFAYASINVFDLIADSNRLGAQQLQLLSKGAPPDKAWGSLAAWAFHYSRAIDYIVQDTDLDPDRIAVYGHSRFGKASILAAALDDRIDLVIAHQSGRAGAALFNSSTGEPIEELVNTYPHWLSQSFVKSKNQGFPLTFDQHHVLALIAPRPILLGHGRRDGWADPDGVYWAAKGASPAYNLYGSKGFTGDDLKTFDPNADIAYWMRPGTHGETKEDWGAFFEFLKIKFNP